MPRTTCLLVAAIPGLVRQEAATVVGTAAGTPPGFYRQADLHFQNMEALSAGFASAEGPKGPPTRSSSASAPDRQTITMVNKID